MRYQNSDSANQVQFRRPNRPKLNSAKHKTTRIKMALCEMAEGVGFPKRAKQKRGSQGGLSFCFPVNRNSFHWRYSKSRIGTRGVPGIAVIEVFRPGFHGYSPDAGNSGRYFLRLLVTARYFALGRFHLALVANQMAKISTA